MDEATKAYLRSLKARLNDVTVVPRVDYSYEDWKPEAKKCHHNVKYLESLNLGYTPVLGWLVINVIALGYYELLAHSIVKSPDGQLVDITPVLENPFGEPRIYPFMVHSGTEDEYIRMIEDVGIVRVRLFYDGRISVGG